MNDIAKGITGSLLIYLALPDVGLTKPQTVLVLIVGWMVSLSLIWAAQEVRERRRDKKRHRKFLALMQRVTLERRKGS